MKLVSKFISSRGAPIRSSFMLICLVASDSSKIILEKQIGVQAINKDFKKKEMELQTLLLIDVM